MRYNGRPHWAKALYLDSNELAAMYPRWGDFNALRNKLDPNKIFWNTFLHTIMD